MRRLKGQCVFKKGYKIMAWTYNVTSKNFYLNGKLKFQARYAGAPGYKNNPDYECLRNRGPLPRGRYRIVGVPFTHRKAGPFTLRLKPYPDNSMCGRDGFLIHGESRKNPGTASNGCIILDRDFRNLIWNSLDKEVIVI